MINNANAHDPFISDGFKGDIHIHGYGFQAQFDEKHPQFMAISVHVPPTKGSYLNIETNIDGTCASHPVSVLMKVICDSLQFSRFLFF